MYKYKRIRLNRNLTRDKHRLIIEKKIGRKLEFNEVVHHINGNMMDNKIENLEMMSRSKHSRLHMLGSKRSKETRIKISKTMRNPFTETDSYCCSCKLMKPHNDFTKNKYNWTGLHHYCKSCWKNYTKI